MDREQLLEAMKEPGFAAAYQCEKELAVLRAELAEAQKDSERLEIKAAYAERDAAMIDVLGLTDGFPYSLQQVQAFRLAIAVAKAQSSTPAADPSE